MEEAEVVDSFPVVVEEFRGLFVDLKWETCKDCALKRGVNNGEVRHLAGVDVVYCVLYWPSSNLHFLFCKESAVVVGRKCTEHCGKSSCYSCFWMIC